MVVNRKKILILSLVSVLILTSLTFFISNQTKADMNSDKEQKAIELQKEIEFAMNEATQIDKNGKVVKVNTKKIKERYGYVPKEYTRIQNEIDNNKPVVNGFRAAPSKSANQCFNEKMNGFLGDFIPVAAIQEMYANSNPKTMLKFSKVAIKAGLKGNAASVAAQITYYYSYCSTHYPDIV